METLSGFILLTAASRSTTIQRESSVVFSWQQWLHERSTVHLHCLSCLMSLTLPRTTSYPCKLFSPSCHIHNHWLPVLWVPVTTAWRFLSLRMEERPPIWWVAGYILNEQLRTANKGWYSSSGVGRGANNSTP